MLEFNLSSYRYNLPKELIAQHPCSGRDRCRLMVVERATGKISEMTFSDLVDFLDSGDKVIFNDTKVIPARLIGKRSGGGATELLLIKQCGEDMWKAMAKPGRKLKPGSVVIFGEGLSCEILETLEDGIKKVRFSYNADANFEEILEKIGHMPLPHYIQRSDRDERDLVDYQTTFARHAGAVAAPTAGLHFTDELFQNLDEKGIEQVMVTLHVGMGTFKPVVAEDIRRHAMHSEEYIVTPKAAKQLNSRSPDKRVICVGTTCCRVLESASDNSGIIRSGSGETDIFIYPGYSFKYVDGLLTNFHLPGSSLMMLVSALAGIELIKEAYSKAIEDKFRFYSYGDAMLII